MALPNHVGVIVDGNRRWAKQRGLTSLEGHRQGYQKVHEAARWLFDQGVVWATFYLFSTENWRRAPEEVAYIFKLFEDTIKTDTANLVKDGIRCYFVGNRGELRPALQELMNQAEEQTKFGRKGNLVAAINYGGRAAIIDGVRQLARSGAALINLTEEQLKQSLSTKDLPDLDLVIRTSGEQRLSNFLLWEAAYAELYFSPNFFPDWQKEDLRLALDWYATRQRRFGAN